MEPIPQKSISEMRQALDVMDISPLRKAETSALLDKIEVKEGMAPKELKELGKLMEVEEKQIKTEISLAQQARKTTSRFIKKTDRIFEDYLGTLRKLR